MVGVNPKKIIFVTTIKEIGAEAKEFQDIKMMILFGSKAPDALRSSCYIIELNTVNSTIKAGMFLQIKNYHYTITAVGSEVQTNLGNLGHIAISFDGLTKPKLPGTLYVENAPYPDVHVGDSIQIIAD
ncbi:PTS glucitol/sorbitol transporter subunit IIA [Bombilactobacillus folatiphilus]|uniref:PTS glucitol/sorbitol transporter subunit IIA n=1 Tax=Bombilactobacillus folatiphilus TaxID=2923362 RepID=A0ABY4P8G5_9LACO|nr:PTS glucitol/sorbitol transporter subunit IIA [Bombilactobacillus folatiphilus]UQS81907.1 PTS glucitol/sorbitol transporter subunit IIA [Bombilactobacillus folatiphilus]